LVVTKVWHDANWVERISAIALIRRQPLAAQSDVLAAAFAILPFLMAAVDRLCITLSRQSASSDVVGLTQASFMTIGEPSVVLPSVHGMKMSTPSKRRMAGRWQVHAAGSNFRRHR